MNDEGRSTNEPATATNTSTATAPATGAGARFDSTGAGLSVPDLDTGVDALTAALAYADAGWYVLPVRRGSKHPGSVVGAQWHHQSSRDPQQIAAWFAGTDYGIALHCGRSGALVFDVDKPELLPDVLRGHLADAVPCQSSRPNTPGRAHYVFRQPPGRTIGNGTGRLGGAWGQVRGLNGVVIAAPSVHEDADNAEYPGAYRWVRTGSVPVLPEGLAGLLDDGSPAEDAATDAQVLAFVAEHTDASRPGLLAGWRRALTGRFETGSRHEAAVSVTVGALKESAAGLLDAATVLDSLGSMFVAAATREPTGGETQRSEALARAEYRAIVAWAVGQALAADPAETLARVADKMPDDFWGTGSTVMSGSGTGASPAVESPPDSTDPDAEPLSNPPGLLLANRGVTGDWLDGQEFAPLAFAVDGILPEGLGLLVAPPKKGKSFLVADIGLAVAAGGTALGAISVTQRPVLYLALEDGHRRLQNRFRRIRRGAPIPAGITVVTRATSAEAVELITEYLGQHAGKKPLVIVDTFGKIKPPRRAGQEAYLADYAAGAALKDIVDAVPGASLLLVHHTRKAEAADFVDSVSGTNGVAGAADFILALNRKRLANDAVLSVTGRDVVEKQYALIADEGILWRLDGMDLLDAAATVERRSSEEKMSGRKLDVLRYVEGAASVVTATDVAKALGGDMAGDTAGKYLRRLADEGLISRAGRGQYLKVSEVSVSGDAAGQGTY